MQTASTPAPYPPTHPPIQNGYQPLTESEIYAIKRQYLGLLPPLQIIDICLTFEAHAPLHVKSTVWPYDIRAAIAAIQAQNAQISQHAPAQQLSPPVDSGDQSNSTSPPKDSSLDSGDKTASSSSEQPPVPSVTHGPASGSAAPHPSAAAHPHQPPQSLPHYPHQPYYHPSYQHAPYYPAPPQPHYNFPPPYPHYPHPPPAQYQSNPPPPPPPSHAPPLFTSAPHPSHPPEPLPSSNNVDDLPSYEEMIVEALIDFGDPEGCAPKALFSWMASHYPLQSNFRPSASQALQKAFKRGRLEKGNNGKYRLNVNWEGGSTSKRTTRRPQTHAQTTLSAHQGHAASSPFTHIPLVHDADAGTSSSQLHASAQGQPGHPYGFGYPGPSTSAANHRPQPAPSETQTTESQVREGSDAWEAAQNILKAINFGQLFQISNEDGAPIHADSATVAQAPPPVFAGSVEVSSTFDSQPVSPITSTSLPSRNTETLLRTELNSDERAALQAELALLAAQLAEFADVSEDELAQDLNPPRSIEEGCVTVATTKPHDSPDSAQPPADQMNIDDDDDDDDDMDMVEVHVPMASLTTFE